MNRQTVFIGVLAMLSLLLLNLEPGVIRAATPGDVEARFNTLMEVLNRHYQNQQFDQAVADARQAVSLAEKSFGPEHPNTTTALYTLAQLYQFLGRYQKSESAYLKLLDYYKQSFAVGELDKAIVREGLASVYTAWGRYRQAEDQLIQVLEKKRSLLGNDSAEVTRTMASLAELYRLMGVYDKAGRLFKEAILRLKDEEGDKGQGLYAVLANQAKLFEDLGKYPQAEALYKKVWEFDHRTFGEKNPNTIIDLNNLAGIYRKQGYFRQAEDTLKQVLADSREVFGEQHPQTITALNNLALLYENIGLYDLAEPAFQEAIRKASAVMGRDHPATINMLNNLALLYESQGLFDKAGPQYLEVLQLSSRVKGVEHPDTVAARNNLAFLYMLQQKYVRAEKQFQLVLNIWEKQLGQTHQKTLKAMNNLARVEHRRGRYEEAAAIFVKVLQLRRKQLGKQHPDAIRSMIDLGALYLDMNRLPEARRILSEALSLAEKNLGDKHPYTFEALNNLAATFEASGDLEKSFELSRLGFVRRTAFLNRILWTTGENTRQAYIRLHRPEQDRYLNLLVRMQTPGAARAALNISLQRKGLLLKIASEIQKIVQLSDSSELKGLTEELQQIQKQLAARTLAGPAGKTAGDFQKELLALEGKRNELQARLGRSSQAYRNTVRQVKVDDVLERLDDKTALVDFLTYTDKREEMLAIVATHDAKEGSRIHLVPIGKLLILRQAVSEYRRMIQDEGTEAEDLAEEGQFVYQTVWKPLIPYLQGRSIVYLVPDSILHLLPFDTLIDSNGQYLLKTLDLRLLSSARDLAESPLPESDRNLLILAGPDYDVDHITDLKQKILDRRGADLNGIRLASVGLRSLSFDKLSGAEAEGNAIKQVSDRKHVKATIYSKRQAEEQQLRIIAEPPQVLHIATHGFFLKAEESMIRRLLSLQRGARNRLPPPGDNPLLRAGLAFAGINANAPFLGDIDTNNDGILTALEALKLNLKGTRLVVLSACETGVGEIHAGEGVYGLRRAFQEAGVKNVLNSLWPVSDEGTRFLMVKFYEQFLAGRTAREALRAAQIAMLDSDWNHPYYWAAFVMVGKK